MNGFDVWRRNLWLWLLPLSVTILAIIALVVYYGNYEGRVAVLETRHAAISGRLESYRAEAQQITELLKRAEAQQQKTEMLYARHFETEGERFTRAITEVKRLARDSGLEPSTFSYPEKAIADYGLIRRNINFGVEGTYRELRTFVNFLELSDQFMTLENISLSGGAGAGGGRGEPRLGISIRLTTFFSQRPVEVDEPAPEIGDEAPRDTSEESPT